MAPPPSANANSVIVRKYGGSSLATIDRIRTAARSIRLARQQGHQVVVVVSAMGKTTNELENLARGANPHPPRRELDMLLSVGERITMSLLSMALAAEGCPAISFTGSQCGIITDTSHTDARILEVRGDRVREALARDQTVVVAGFQGVSLEKEITTLGRGGSDTTAVALASALQAERCEIFKDVPGVMNADPDLIPTARPHSQLSWDQLGQIAASGCGVVHLRAVEYAAKHEVPLVIRSSFEESAGTTVSCLSDQPVAARESRFRPLAMIVHDDVARLGLATNDHNLARLWRDLVLSRLDTAATVAEWLDSGQGFRWEVLAPAPVIKPLLEEVSQPEFSPEGSLVHEEDLACISLAGGQPDCWLEVERDLSSLLCEIGCPGWRLRADGSCLRVLVKSADLEDVPARLHARLFPV